MEMVHISCVAHCPPMLSTDEEHCSGFPSFNFRKSSELALSYPLPFFSLLEALEMCSGHPTKHHQPSPNPHSQSHFLEDNVANIQLP